MENRQSEELFRRALQVSPGGVHSPVRAFKSVGGKPVFFKSAKGAMLTSVDGDEYIDFCMAFGPLLLGHRDPDVAKVIDSMLNTAWSFGTCDPYSLDLAEWIVKRVPWAEKIRFVSSGTEAVMSALRVARAATGRNKILKFEGCYHGHADSLLVKAGSGLAGESVSDSAGVSVAVAAETLTAKLNDIESVRRAFLEFGSQIAAVILEPLPANYGLLIQEAQFWKDTIQIARQNGALIIFDEVISGFRVGMGGMAQRLGEKPDLVTYGKIMGGGFPVGAYGGRRDLMDMVAPSGPVYQAGTMSANPVGMAAGLATLSKVESQGVHEKLKTWTQDFCSELISFYKSRGLPLAIAFVDSIFWIHPAGNTAVRTIADFKPNLSQEYASFFQNCLKRGLYLAPSGYEVSFMSFAHNEEVRATAVKIIKEASLEAYGKSAT